MFVRDSCSKQLDSDRLAADVPEGEGCDVVAALQEQLTALQDTFSATTALNVNLQVTSSNKDGLQNGGGGSDVSDWGQSEWASDEEFRASIESTADSVVEDTRGPHTIMTMAPEGDQLAGGADRVARSMVREQQRDDSPGKRRSEGRSSRLSSLNMKMCTLTPTPVE